ncbi:MAG: flagellar protein FliS [Gammaproteobacteria bacterium]|nr:flagellar protein FliS [Gammaproteobacteria bacterium]
MNITNNDAYKINPLPAEELKSIWQDDPMRVVVMLFDKTLQHIGQARSTLLGWGDEHYQTHILNAVSVIDRLQTTLNHESHSAMAANLEDIYRYIVRLLINTLQQKNHESLNQAISLLLGIREALAVYVKKNDEVLQH